MQTLQSLESLQPAITEMQVQPAPHQLVYQVKLITPMYGGGAIAGEPDKAMPFRTRSLRGQLRFWWRVAMMGAQAVDGAGQPVAHDAKNWRQKERDIWGGLTADSTWASKVGLHIDQIKDINTVHCDKVIAQNPKLGYALFSGKSNQREDVVGQEVIDAGAQFRLTVTVTDPALLDTVHQTIRYWATFGGIGARTSRGLGAVCVTQNLADGGTRVLCVLPATVLAENFNGGGAANAITVSVKGAIKPFVAPAVHRTATQAWAIGIGKLWQFRQAPVLARHPPGGDRIPGLSFWPKADTVRDATGGYTPPHKPLSTRKGLGRIPEADFGLPIVLKFKDGPKGASDKIGYDPAMREILPDDPEQTRMASPLFLRPVALPDGTGFFCVAILIHRAKIECRDPALPLLSSVRLAPDARAGHPATYPVQTKDWAPSLAPYLTGVAYPNATNAVEMFLNYFCARDAV